MTINLNSISSTDGILFVALKTNEGIELPDDCSGDAKFSGICDSFLSMFDHTEESSLSAVVGDHSVRGLKTDSGRLAVVMIKGHPQGKSVARLMRRFMRKLKPKSPSPQPSTASTAPPPAA